MKKINNEKVAREMVAIARDLVAAEGDTVEEEDPQFAQQVRGLRQKMNKLVSKKNRKLNQFGIEMIRPSATVKDLVAALGKILAAS